MTPDEFVYVITHSQWDYGSGSEDLVAIYRDRTKAILAAGEFRESLPNAEGWSVHPDDPAYPEMVCVLKGEDESISVERVELR